MLILRRCTYTVTVLCKCCEYWRYYLCAVCDVRVSLLLLSGVHLQFVITEHNPPFLFWSWCYLAGTVTSAYVLIILLIPCGLQIYSECVFVCLCYGLLPGLNSSITMQSSFWFSGFETIFITGVLLNVGFAFFFFRSGNDWPAYSVCGVLRHVRFWKGFPWMPQCFTFSPFQVFFSFHTILNMCVFALPACSVFLGVYRMVHAAPWDTFSWCQKR